MEKVSVLDFEKVEDAFTALAGFGEILMDYESAGQGVDDHALPGIQAVYAVLVKNMKYSLDQFGEALFPAPGATETPEVN